MKEKKQLTQAEKEALALKMEVAEELGLLDKVEKVGFRGLTSRESGQIGGIISRRLKEEGKKGSQPCNQTKKDI